MLSIWLFRKISKSLIEVPVAKKNFGLIIQSITLNCGNFKISAAFWDSIMIRFYFRPTSASEYCRGTRNNWPDKQYLGLRKNIKALKKWTVFANFCVYLLQFLSCDEPWALKHFKRKKMFIYSNHIIFLHHLPTTKTTPYEKI